MIVARAYRFVEKFIAVCGEMTEISLSVCSPFGVQGRESAQDRASILRQCDLEVDLGIGGNESELFMGRSGHGNGMQDTENAVCNYRTHGSCC